MFRHRGYHHQGDLLVKWLRLACWTCITLIWKTPWEWHPSAETCRRLILVTYCILLSAFVGWWTHVWFSVWCWPDAVCSKHVGTLFSVWCWPDAVCSKHVGTLFPGLRYKSYEYKKLWQSTALHFVKWMRCVLFLTACCRYDFSI